jgi:hypothetical protein
MEKTADNTNFYSCGTAVIWLKEHGLFEDGLLIERDKRSGYKCSVLLTGNTRVF